MVQSLSRIGRGIVTAVLVGASLFTFPSAIPWMVAFWLACHTLLVVRDRPGWPPLAACVVILLVKRSDWPPAAFVLAALMLVACLLGGPWLRIGRSIMSPFASRKATNRARKGASWIAVVILWGAWGWMAFEWCSLGESVPRRAILPGRPVVCFGDSLTSYGYPAVLQRLVSIPVINEGRDGLAAREAVRRIQALVQARPQAVIVELGGHDFLQGRSRAETRDDLIKIADACRAIGAEVILMEIPRGAISDGYGGLERQLARQYNSVLIPDTPIRRLILWSPTAPPGIWLPRESHLSNDGLHPNRLGNELLARYAADALVRVYGPEVRAGSKPVESGGGLGSNSGTKQVKRKGASHEDDREDPAS